MNKFQTVVALCAAAGAAAAANIAALEVNSKGGVEWARVPGKPTHAVVTSPRDPSEKIAPSAEEKARAKVPG